MPLAKFLSDPKQISSAPGIYVIYNVDKFHPYIGESNNVRRRLIEHATTKFPTQYVDREIQKLGWDKFEVGFVEKVTELGPRRNVERQYVRLFNSYYNGYNGSPDGHPMSEFQRWKKRTSKKLARTISPKLTRQYNKSTRYQGWISLCIFAHRH